MTKRFLFPLLAALVALLPAKAHSQDGDGFGFGGGPEDGSFGFDASPAESPASTPAGAAIGSAYGDATGAATSVAIGGEASAALLGFVDDFDSWSSAKAAGLGDVFSGVLNFFASGSAADAAINLRLVPTASPLGIDEAYVRAYFGPVDVEGGLRKLIWGRADSYGPLDVINPLDYTDLTKISDPISVKLARPLLHVSWGIGSFSKLEAVFVPGFRGHRFALDGRWAPSQIVGLTQLGFSAADLQNLYWDSDSSLRFAQAGVRFTTSIASSDLGAQYYYGRLPRPALNIRFGLAPPIAVNMDYNSYHQIGVDFARVIAGFNARAEAAINITEDLAGDRPNIYNPSVAWSVGFDRDVIAGINVNLQAVETIRLFHSKIGNDPLALDTETGKDVTSTRLTLILSKKFFRDRLELKAVGLWDIEDPGFLVMPGIVYSDNDVSVELKGGVFGGDRDGELGQYRDNYFVKTILTYSF
jgi:hypothetical protein